MALMPPKPGTGNALTDANQPLPVVGAGRGAGSPGTVNVAQQQAQINAINAINQQNAAAASNCLWPSSAKITIPIIPGLLHQSFQVPCLITFSEARAVFGALLIGAGFGIMGFGVSIIVVEAFGPTVAEAGGAAASLAGAPEVGIPVAAAGAEVKHKRKQQKQAAPKPAPAPAKQDMTTAS